MRKCLDKWKWNNDSSSVLQYILILRIIKEKVILTSSCKKIIDKRRFCRENRKYYDDFDER